MYYEIKNEYLTVKIDSLGAQLHSIKNNKDIEYLWQKDKKSWNNQAPNLFPFIGRLTEEKYIYNNKFYKMGIHGFAKLFEMKVELNNEKEIKFILKSNEETKIIYPFDFIYIVKYNLTGKKLNICYEVINDGENSMYFGIGGHPGFNVPIDKDELFEDYNIEFDENLSIKRINMSDDCFVCKGTTPFELRNSKFLDLNHNLFNNDAVILTDMGEKVALNSNKYGKRILVGFPSMKYLSIWHCPKSKVNFVCIEPWTSLPSRLNVIEELDKKEDLIELKSGCKYNNDWYIEIL